MGTRKGADMPDLGVVANRYTLMLAGNLQRLRLLSWEAVPRVDRTIAWDWKPDTWYRLKLRVDVQGDKALVRGKAWPRGESEPTNWTIDFEDPTNNFPSPNSSLRASRAPAVPRGRRRPPRAAPRARA